MRALVFDYALTPDGWARDVGVDVEGGTIRAVVPGAETRGRERVPGVALPGMPNLHSHTFQRAMAGLSETRGPTDDSFWTWRRVMYAFLGSLDPDDIEAIAAYAFLEMLESGFTAVAEFHYLHHDPQGRAYAERAELAQRIVAAAGEVGIGLTLLPVHYAQGGFGAAPPEHGQRRFVDDVEGLMRIVEGVRPALAALPNARLGIAPHSLRATTPESLGALLAANPEGPVHIHVAEQVKEVEDCLAWSGARPVAWLLDNAPVDARWCLIHATHLDASEQARLAASGAVAGLCPITEANLGDGVFPAAEVLGAGGRFGVGTDSNVEISAFGELRQLEYGQRLTRRARNVLAGEAGRSTGRRLWEGALAGGAQALGLAVGALAPGLRADVVTLDLDHPDLCGPVGDRSLDTAVFCLGRAAVRDVLVGGERVVENGRHRARARVAARYAARVGRLAALA
ncbi:formimidoylglutamate deiminase [Salinarimonas rosea]|uniref:formimidoylglutamate deiminase n=1 Tax=Salinarimonas rosea TaxID=552063 RepID=UPI0004164CC4|nr:formimidoylglutamate deiminase [Salinarimonas rosea]